MPLFSRRNIVKALSIIGLKKTLVALRDRDEYSINWLTTPNGEVALERIATISDPNPHVIGRVGMPDPKLGIAWNKSMTFYGMWFDDLAASDSDYRIRNGILGLSRDKVLNQISRDDKYGLIGTYYAVFLEVLSVKNELPVVVLDDSLLGLGSFPVIIAKIDNTDLKRELINALRISLRLEREQEAPQDAVGLDVSDVSVAEASQYFPAHSS